MRGHPGRVKRHGPCMNTAIPAACSGRGPEGRRLSSVQEDYCLAMCVWCSILLSIIRLPTGLPGSLEPVEYLLLTMDRESETRAHGEEGLTQFPTISSHHSEQGWSEPLLLKCTPRMEARRRGDICQQNSKECRHLLFLNLTLILF